MNEEVFYEVTATFKAGYEKDTGVAKIEQEEGLEVYITNPANGSYVKFSDKKMRTTF